MHYAYTYPPNPDHWRELIRYVLPRIKHTTRPVAAPGGSLSQPTMVYLGDVGKTMSVADVRARKRKNRVTENRKPRRVTSKWTK